MNGQNGWGWVNGEGRPTLPSQQIQAPRPCREDGFCDAVYRENDRGGEARGVVLMAARALGLELGQEKATQDIWASENMMRLVFRARAVMAENENLRQQLARRQTRTVAALHEALSLLEEERV